MLISIFALFNFLFPFLKIIDFGNVEITFLSDILSNPIYEAILGDGPFNYSLYYDSFIEAEPSLPNEFLWDLFDLWEYVFILNSVLGITFLLTRPVLELTGFEFETKFPFVSAGFLFAFIAVIVEYGLIFLVIITGNITNELYSYKYSINILYFVFFVLGTVALILGYFVQTNRINLFGQS